MRNTRAYCCEMMTAQITHHCDQHDDIYACPDVLISHRPESDTYGLIIHDGGRASITIHVCPWCGATLPPIVRASYADATSPESDALQPGKTRVRLPTAAITDWDSFHEVCQETFGFPIVYGRNMNAWIDCLTYLDLGDGMSRFHLRSGEQLIVEVLETDAFIRRVPDLFASFVETTAVVNQRYIQDGKQPMIALVFR